MARRRGNNSTPISLFAFQDIITSITGVMILVTLMMVLELLQRKVAAPALQTTKIIKAMRPVVERQDQEIVELQEELAREEQTLRELAGIDAAGIKRDMDDLERLSKQLQEDVDAVRREEASADSRLRRSEAEKARRASDATTLEELTEQVRQTQRKFEELKSSNRVIYNVASSAPTGAWLVEIDADRISAAPAGKSATPTVFSGSRSARAAAFLRWAAGRGKTSQYFMLLIKPDGVDSFDQLLSGLKSAGFRVGFDLMAAADVAIDPKTGALPR